MTGKRAENVARIQALLAEGLTSREIAGQTGLAYSTVREYITDPDSVQRGVRRARYAGTCERCGGETKSDGTSRASRLCAPCLVIVRRAKHGSLSRYKSGCRCDECRGSMRVYARSLKGRPAPSHGVSGYVNYACRCAICKAAVSANNRLHAAKRKARAA